MAKADKVARDRLKVAGEVLDALLRLEAKGAYLAPLPASSDAAGEALAVFQARAGADEAVSTLPRQAVYVAERRGWLAADPGSGRYRLAPAGIEALRRLKCANKPKRKKPALANSTAPVRSAQQGPLAWLRRRKDRGGLPLVTGPQFAAGERLAADYWHAQLVPRVTSNWSGTAPGQRMRRAAPGAGVEMSDRVVAARVRVERALAAVGPELAGILVDVCCHDIGLEVAGRSQGWPQRAAKVVLQLALTRLARHYGLIAPEPPPGPRRLRHWGSDDYRPDLDAWRS
jgi:hypothetical protein